MKQQTCCCTHLRKYHSTHSQTHIQHPTRGSLCIITETSPYDKQPKSLSSPHMRGIVMSAGEKKRPAHAIFPIPHCSVCKDSIMHPSFSPLHFCYDISQLLLNPFLTSSLSCILFPLQFSFHHLHLSLVFRFTPPSSSICLVKCRENSFSSDLVSSHILSCYISLGLDEFTNWFRQMKISFLICHRPYLVLNSRAIIRMNYAFRKVAK